MKALTIKEPWASLIVNGYKKYEFRSWNTKYRGKILIHTSQSMEKKNKERFKDYNLDLKPGYIIGEAEITDVIWIDEEKHKELLEANSNVYKNSVNCYGFKIENVIKYENPIPAKGKLGFWDFYDKNSINQ